MADEIVKQYRNYKHKKLFGITCTENRPRGSYPLHRHDYFELEYIADGAVDHELNGTSKRLEAGCCYCLGLHDLHRFTVLSEVKIRNVCIDIRSAPDAIRKQLGSVELPMAGRFDRDRLDGANRLFDLLFEEINRPSGESEARVTAYLLLLFALFSEASVSVRERPISQGYRHVKKAIDYIAENYSSPLTLKEVASHVYLNEHYFSRIFTETAGNSFSAYLTEFRIEKARELLSSTEKSVTDIAFQCGFGSFSTFSRVFKKRCNCTPTVYRTNTCFSGRGEGNG